MKFGMEVVLEGEGSWGHFDPIPHPPGYRVCKGVQGTSGASAMHFGENFNNKKVAGHP